LFPHSYRQWAHAHNRPRLREYLYNMRTHVIYYHYCYTRVSMRRVHNIIWYYNVVIVVSADPLWCAVNLYLPPGVAGNPIKTFSQADWIKQTRPRKPRRYVTAVGLSRCCCNNNMMIIIIIPKQRIITTSAVSLVHGSSFPSRRIQKSADPHDIPASKRYYT